MLDFYRNLGAAERRTFAACFGGWALDALDIQIYTFAAALALPETRGRELLAN
jgi:hypothetical protein